MRGYDLRVFRYGHRKVKPPVILGHEIYHDLIFCIAYSISVSTHALGLGQRTIRADGKIFNELKIKRQADTVLRFLKGTDTNAVMESGYSYQYLYDLLKSKGFDTITYSWGLFSKHT